MTGRTMLRARRASLPVLVAASLLTAGSAQASVPGPFLVLKHNAASLGQQLYKPKDLQLRAGFGSDGLVQRTTWTGWGTSVARGKGQILANSRQLVARVTLVASNLGPLGTYGGCQGTPGVVPPITRYRSLRVHISWLPDPGWGSADRAESRALSGNLAGTPTQQC